MGFSSLPSTCLVIGMALQTIIGLDISLSMPSIGSIKGYILNISKINTNKAVDFVLNKGTWIIILLLGYITYTRYFLIFSLTLIKVLISLGLNYFCWNRVIHMDNTPNENYRMKNKVIFSHLFLGISGSKERPSSISRCSL